MEGSFIDKFVKDCKGKDAVEVGRYLENSREVGPRSTLQQLWQLLRLAQWR